MGAGPAGDGSLPFPNDGVGGVGEAGDDGVAGVVGVGVCAAKTGDAVVEMFAATELAILRLSSQSYAFSESISVPEPEAGGASPTVGP